MRRRIIHMALVLLLLFALLLPAGCAPKDDGPLTMNPDGTLGLLRWGMTLEQAEKADKRIVLTMTDSGGYCDLEFLGRKWQLSLWFARFDEEGPDAALRLYSLRLYPAEAGEWETLIGPLETMLGPRNIRTYYRNQKWQEDGSFTCTSQRELEDWERYWASEKSIGDRVNRKTLEKAYPDKDPEAMAKLRYGTPLYEIMLVFGSDIIQYSPEWPPPPEEVPMIGCMGKNTVKAALLKGS